jgi:glycosyltransferase involved in cell wall biosynthesis
MRVSFVVPTLNEAQGIRRTLDDLPIRQLKSLGFEIEVLVIDGESTDGTPEIAREHGARVITEPRPGYGRAYKTGLAAVDSDYIITGDADGTYPFDRVLTFLEQVRANGIDFATFNRYEELEDGAMSLKHRFGNGVLTKAARALFGVRLRDSQSGMWIITRQALDRLPIQDLSDGMAFSQEIKIEAFLNPRVAAAELPGSLRRRVGQVKLNSWRDGLGNLFSLYRHRRTRRAWVNGQA